MNVSPLTHDRPRRAVVVAQLAVFCAVTALLVPLITPQQAVGGGPLVKILFLARIASLVGVATWLLRSWAADWRDLGLCRPRWRRAGLSIPLGLIVIAAAVALTGVALGRMGIRGANDAMFGPVHGNFPEYLFWAIPVAWGSAALGEELIFRGLIRFAVERAIGEQRRGATSMAIVLQALLFGALHSYQGAGGAIVAGVIGLLLGFVWLFSGRNLWPAIIIHGLLDFGSMTTIYLGIMQA